jgi:hypothetical protein
VIDYERWCPFVDIDEEQSDFDLTDISEDLGLNRTQECVLTDRLFNQIDLSVWPDEHADGPRCELRVFFQGCFIAGADLAKMIEAGFGKGLNEDEVEIAALETVRAVIDAAIKRIEKEKAA